MGACYSKQPSLGTSSKSKAPKIKYHTPKDNGHSVKETDDRVPEGDAQEECTKLVGNELQRQDSSEDVLVVTSSLFLESESGPPTRTDNIRDRGVAPSDSGIESIGTIPDDSQEIFLPVEARSDLSKRLQRLSRGSCHKCGNFKLDDTAITALLSNTYCLCGPRQAGRPNVNPKCQTHGARNVKREDGSTGEDNSMGVRNTHLVTSEVAEHTIDSYDSLNASSNSKSFNASNAVVNGDSEVLAPLAHFDSVDTNLNDSPSPSLRSSKRRSLLSEILDLTDSICKCDFYSNEYCCVADDKHAKSQQRNDAGARISNKVSQAPVGENLTDISFESQASDITITKSDSEEQANCSDSQASKSVFTSPKKTLSLTKNVSFANEENAHGDDIEKVFTHSSTNKLNCRYVKESDNHALASEASSGVFTHSGSASMTQLTPFKDFPKRTLALGIPGALLSSSSSDALDDRTEDDLASLDLDSLSRVTSLSYGSIRQLVESTEDLVQPLEDVRRVVIDGEDFVAIPTETYFQLQSDLASLRQQLLSLSSLMQEEPDQQTLSASFGI